MPPVRSFELSRKYLDYLSDVDFLSTAERHLIWQTSDAPADAITLQLPEDDAERLRDRFTEQLAKVGFDESYELTEEGALLEELIDLLS